MVPTVKFTTRGISALPAPADGRVEYWDSSMPGFGLRISSNGSRSWVLMYRVGRAKRRMKLGTFPTLGLADARDAARAAMRLVEVGGDPARDKGERRAADTVATAFAEYLKRHARPNKKSARRDELVFEKDVKPEIGSMLLADVKRRHVVKVLDRVADRGAMIQANRTLEIIRKFFNWCVGRDLIEHSPCVGVSKPTEERSRSRVFSPDEIRALWKAADGEGPITGGLFKLRLVTLQRGAEVLTMARGDIVGSWWTIPAERSKNGLPHRVWLSEPAMDLVKAAMEASGSSPWVFPGHDRERPRGYIHKAWKRIVEAAEVSDAVPHDLRRTGASHMGSMSINRLVIGKVLNHVETGVTAVYDRHSYDPEKQRALDAWADRLTAILEERSEADNVVSMNRG